MVNVTLKHNIWFYSLMKYIYPYLKNEGYVLGENSYDEVIDFFIKKNSFFTKFKTVSREESLFVQQIVDVVSNCINLKTNKSVDQYEPVHSLFSDLFQQSTENIYFLPLIPLDSSNLLPSTIKFGDIHQLFSGFFKEVEQVKSDEQILFLLEKYFWSVASLQALDVSLYDEMKSTAAIAVSLYEQNKSDGFLSENVENIIRRNDEEEFILIHGDVSGIQRFIFNIPSKGAAKSLKGRSVYISLLSDVIVRYFLNELQLYPTNLLFNGGGNFYILAPKNKLEQFYELRKQVLLHLLNGHAGEIYFAIDAIAFSASELQDFSKIMEKVKNKTNQLKLRKWSELDLTLNVEKIFGPFKDENEDSTVCRVCGSFGRKESMIEENLEDETVPICSLCRSFIELTDELKDAKYIVYRKKEKPEDNNYANYNDVFQHFGYRVHFSSKKHDYRSEADYWYLLNDTQFLSQGCIGYQFGAFKLPMDKNILTFAEIAERNVNNGMGDKKLAHLKLDVDNLGSLFGIGLGNKRSLARISWLSRMIGLYFGAYINHLIQSNNWQEHLYVVFSGGDDSYIIGSWKEVFQFADKFYSDFRTYTCNNPYVTFSAGIRVFDYRYPIVRAAELSENALDAAKEGKNSNDSNLPPKKDKISFLGEVFNWKEFKQIHEIEQILEEMVKKYDNRSILRKVALSTRGFKTILHDSTKRKFRNLKFWRLSYFLRSIHHDVRKKRRKGMETIDYSELLIKKYREIVLHNVFHSKDDEQIKRIMIIPAAIKWAEMATRKVNGSEGK